MVVGRCVLLLLVEGTFTLQESQVQTAVVVAIATVKHIYFSEIGVGLFQRNDDNSSRRTEIVDWHTTCL